ncbi:MAG: GldG family protein [Planctomycetota bacterium]
MGASRKASFVMLLLAAAGAAAVAWSVASAWFEGDLTFGTLLARPLFAGGLAALGAAYAAALAASRRARAATLAAVGVAAMVVITLSVSLDADKYSPQRSDVTFAQVNRLSDQTLRVLEEIPRGEIVKVTTFMSPETEKDRLFERRVKELLEEYEVVGRGAIEVGHVDVRASPERAQLAARELGLERVELQSVVFATGEGERRRRKVVSRQEIQEEEAGLRGRYVHTRARFQGEEAFTAAVLAVVRGTPTKVYFLTGHGERDARSFKDDGYGPLAEWLRGKGFEVSDALSLAETKSVPEDCGVLVAAGPKSRIRDEELSAIGKYLEQGGPALFLVEPLVEDTGLRAFLARYGVEVGHDVVIEMGEYLLTEVNPVVREYPAHPITERLGGNYTTLYLACSVEPKGGAAAPILRSSARSWAETEVESLLARKTPRFDIGKDRRGPVGLAAAVGSSAAPQSREAGPGEKVEARLVVIGDSDLGSALGLNLSPTNRGFLLNVMNWLRREEKLVSIPSKDLAAEVLEMTSADRRRVGLIAILGVPLGVVAAGGVVWLLRSVRSR